MRIVGGDLLARGHRHRRADRDRPEQVAHLRVRAQVGADALPQVVDAAAAPVVRDHEAATQLHALRDADDGVVRVLEQGRRIEAADAVRGQHRRAARDAVGTRDLRRRVVPQHDVFVPAVPGIDVDRAAGALAHRAKGELAQAADLAQQRRIGGQRADPDLLAVAGFAEEAHPGDASAHQGRIDRMGDRVGTACAFRWNAFAAGADRIQLAADRLEHGRAIHVIGNPTRVADAQHDAPCAPGEHLARQQGGAGRLEQRGRPVEQRGVAGLDTHRQHRRIAGAGEAQEAAPPAGVAHAARSKTGDLAGREHDHALAVGECRVHRAQAVRGRSPAEDAHRQQQVLNVVQRGQDVVGDDAHVATHLAYRIQQRQCIERAGRMVGDEQQRAVRRDPRQCPGIDLISRA